MGRWQKGLATLCQKSSTAMGSLCCQGADSQAASPALPLQSPEPRHDACPSALSEGRQMSSSKRNHTGLRGKLPGSAQLSEAPVFCIWLAWAGGDRSRLQTAFHRHAGVAGSRGLGAAYSLQDRQTDRCPHASSWPSRLTDWHVLQLLWGLTSLCGKWGRSSYTCLVGVLGPKMTHSKCLLSTQGTRVTLPASLHAPWLVTPVPQRGRIQSHKMPRGTVMGTQRGCIPGPWKLHPSLSRGETQSPVSR